MRRDAGNGNHLRPLTPQVNPNLYHLRQRILLALAQNEPGAVGNPGIAVEQDLHMLLIRLRIAHLGDQLQELCCRHGAQAADDS